MPNEKREESLAEPDSDEAINDLVQRFDDLTYGKPGITQGTWPMFVEYLREFAQKVREHERLALRERPTQPDLKVLIEHNERLLGLNGHCPKCQAKPRERCR